MATPTVKLGELDIDAIAASFQAHIIRGTADPDARARSLMALARTWWIAVAGGEKSQPMLDAS
jgi:hypothetical protein